MKSAKAVLTFLLTSILALAPTLALAIYGQRGDIMVTTYIDNCGNREVNMKTMDIALLAMHIPQYQFGDAIMDLQIYQEKCMYHTEVVTISKEYVNEHGYTWLRFQFTDFAKTMLDPGEAGDIYDWIIDNCEYRLPFDEVQEVYQKFYRGEVTLGNIPLIMIGTEFGQTVDDYTNFNDFYGSFMNKYWYCITATNWAICKAMYDQNPYVRDTFDAALSDPQAVQSFDSLTAGRLLGFLDFIGFIEEY